eukprot:9713019-Karenia_brevis.AAC.1
MAPVKTRAGRDRKGDTRPASVVAGRIQSAWRGDWGTLWRDAVGSRRSGSVTRSKDQALQDDVRVIDAYLSDGLVSKAVAVARGAVSTLVGSGAAEALRVLFPAGELPTPSALGSGVSADLRAKLEAAAA